MVFTLPNYQFSGAFANVLLGITHVVVVAVTSYFNLGRMPNNIKIAYTGLVVSSRPLMLLSTVGKIMSCLAASAVTTSTQPKERSLGYRHKLGLHIFSRITTSEHVPKKGSSVPMILSRICTMHMG